MNTWLFILLFCAVPTMLYISLWHNRKRIVRWVIRRRPTAASQILTQALAQRLINPTDEAGLRKEFGITEA